MIAIILLAVSASGGPLQVAEATADRCLYTEALKILNNAPMAEQQTSAGRNLRARLLIQLGRGKEALGVLSTTRPATKREGADHWMLVALAFSAAHDVAAAEKALTRSAHLGGDKVLIDAARGMLRLQRGRLVEADAILRSVLKREPRLTGALYNLACVRSLTGDVAEAAALLRMSWEFGLKDPDQIRKDPMLQRLRDTHGLIDDLVTSPVRHCGTY